MLNPTVSRRWTIATWLLAGFDDDNDRAADDLAASLRALNADVIVLQSVPRSLAERLGATLAMHSRWALSHYRRSPLLRGSGVGLATLTPHTIRSSTDRVISPQESTWSPKRRIAQSTLVQRADHSAYQVLHAGTSVDDAAGGGAPTIVVRPAQVGIDAGRAVELPKGSVVVSNDSTAPIAGAQPLLTVTFDHDWVAADFPTS